MSLMDNVFFFFGRWYFFLNDCTAQYVHLSVQWGSSKLVGKYLYVNKSLSIFIYTLQKSQIKALIKI